MLGTGHRFHGYNSLKSVYARGQTVRGQLVSLRFALRDTQKPYRVAVVVSRKVHKSAVVRNRIRRRLYAAVRRQSALIPPGTDLVFTVYGEQLAETDAGKLEDNVRQLLTKAAKKPAA